METITRIRRELTKRAAAVGSLVFLLVAYNRIWSGTSPPWETSDEELQQLKTFYPDRYEDALESTRAFVYSAYLYPSRVL
jgi:hypothetical protein